MRAAARRETTVTISGMRIVHVVAVLDPAKGGPPMIAAKLAAAQAGLGHDVHMVFAEDPERRTVVRASLSSIPFFDSLHMHPLPPKGLLEQVFGMGAHKYLEPLIEKADAVHLHGVWESILRVAGAICRRYDKPYLVLLNGMLDPWSLEQSALKKKVALEFGYRRMLNGAAALHLGNVDEQELIKPLGLTVPGVLIPNGVFPEEVDPLPEAGEFYAAHPELAEEPYVLFLSRLHYKKGLDHLAALFALVAREDPRVRLVVAGPDGGAQEDFETRIREAGISNRVHLVGPVYGRMKWAALVDSDCFCLPSRQEGFSMAITEALAAGVPAVISEPCHFPEVATANAGFVLPLEAQRFADAILRLLRDAALRRSMGGAGRELVMTRYTWPKIAEQTINAYQAALQKA